MRWMKRMSFVFKLKKSIPFLIDFFLSKEIRFSVKLSFVVAFFGYLFLPFDLIPDFLLVLGLVDDLSVALFLLQWMVKIAPPSLKEKHGYLEQIESPD